MDTHEKFLDFNGNKIVFLSVEGNYWIALKPILNALKMDADRAIKTLKKDPILAPERSVQAVQVSKNGKKQLRNMTCLPEYFIYGWIFSLRSDSAELDNFKKTCYQLLFNHFHGTITNRKELLLQEKEVIDRIAILEEELKSNDPKHKELIALQAEKKILRKNLLHSDKQLIKQTAIQFN